MFFELVDGIQIKVGKFRHRKVVRVCQSYEENKDVLVKVHVWGSLCDKKIVFALLDLEKLQKIRQCRILILIT